MRPGSPEWKEWHQGLRTCTHCGLCLQACPTYVLLGNEADSARGRIYLLRSFAEGRARLGDAVGRHLDLCLACRACESACPSHVPYGRVFEHARPHAARRRSVRVQSLLTSLIARYLLPHPSLLRAASQPVRLARRARLEGLAALSPNGAWGFVGSMMSLIPGEKVNSATRAAPPPGSGVFPALPPRRARVALWRCCVTDALTPQVSWASLRVLVRNGCEVIIPKGQVCCGALALHEGDVNRAKAQARHNVRLLRALFASPPAGGGTDAIVTDSAGCGAVLKEYGRLLADEPRYSARAAAIAGKVRDINEFLADLGPVRPEHQLDVTVTYHDACHLAHAQGIRDQPRQLIHQVPGARLKEMDEPDRCCGSAGTYGLRHREIGLQLRERKVSSVLATGASVLISANIGCTLHIAAGLRTAGRPLPVLHPVELLDLAYSGRALQVPSMRLSSR